MEVAGVWGSFPVTEAAIELKTTLGEGGNEKQAYTAAGAQMVRRNGSPDQDRCMGLPLRLRTQPTQEL